jgi:hypothetical protein
VKEMTLTLDTHYKYDEFGRYFYLTPVGAELITGIDSLDNDWNNVERRLKSQGKLLKMIMSFSLNDNSRKRYRRQDVIEYLQYKNANNEQDDIFYMLGELAEWAWDDDGDRMVYQERNPFDILKYMPLTIQQRGEASNLIFFGKTRYEVPIAEYQVGY